MQGSCNGAEIFDETAVESRGPKVVGLIAEFS